VRVRGHSFPVFVIVLLVFCSRVSLAATCPHLTSDRAPLYTQSAFAHGYIHGYEEGFHVGNQDMQLARGTRDVTKSANYRQAGEHYRQEFGARDAFRAGFRDGLVVGYTDATTGHSFRAIDEARIAAGQLVISESQPKASDEMRRFELGFMDGYGAGALQGVGDGRNRANYRPQQAECSNGRDGISLGESYCAAYVRGFGFGYSDGYINYDALTVTHKKARQALVTAAKK
jgi:hypothetical protein